MKKMNHSKLPKNNKILKQLTLTQFLAAPPCICEKCKIEFDEEDLDMVNDKWLCRACEAETEAKL